MFVPPAKVNRMSVNESCLRNPSVKRYHTVMQNIPADERPLRSDEILYWAEFACWTAVVLAPFLRLVNGPSVSTDQFVVRTVLVVTALLGACSLRLYKLLIRRRDS